MIAVSSSGLAQAEGCEEEAEKPHAAPYILEECLSFEARNQVLVVSGI